MIAGQPGQTAAAEVLNATTGAAFAGSVTVYVTINGVQTLGSVSAGAATLIGQGLYEYYPSSAETNAALVAFTFTGTGAIPVTVQYATVTPAQQAALVVAGSFAARSASALITGALFEIRVARAGDLIAPEIMDYGLQLLNELLDEWNGVPDRRALYAEAFQNFTLTPSLNPHTIGPTGTFSVPVRPISLEFAALDIQGGPPDVYRPLNVRSRRWYANLPVPGLATSIPTDVYYEPGWPNGSLYFWPVPTSAYPVRLWTRTMLTSLALTSTFSLPPGYQAAVRLTLAEMLAPGLGQTASASTMLRARQARAKVFANNEQSPALHTLDSGLGTGTSTGVGFNWLSRTNE